METINTFYGIQTQKNKKFIGCYIDDDFFQKDFTLRAVDKIDQDIIVIEKLMMDYSQRRLDTTDLNFEKTRLYDLRNNLVKIIGTLRESLCIDIREDKFNENLPKIISAIMS